MTSDESPETLETLLEERDRYAGWLSRLAARGDAAPSHVVERVRADYEARLAMVQGRIAARAGELETEVVAARERLERAQAAEQKAHDERAEAEVRFAVGEYSAERWETIARESDAGLAALGADHASARAEVDRLESALAAARSLPGDARPAPAAMGAVAAATGANESAARETPAGPAALVPAAGDGAAGESPEAAGAPDEEGGEAPRPLAEVAGSGVATVASPEPVAGGAAPEAADRAERPSSASATEPARGTRVTATTEPALPTAPGGRPATGEQGAVPSRRSSGQIVNGPAFDELAFLKSLAPTPATPPTTQPRVDASAGAPSEPPALPTPVAEPALPVADPAADAGPFGRPATPAAPEVGVREGARTPTPSSFLRSVRSSEATQAKTLRCAECGTLNYSTEWYCERCGGELASM